MRDTRPIGLPPIITAHLFRGLDARLLELLRSLTPEEWLRPTIVPKWSVQQVAAHLLDTGLRRLSVGRDGRGSNRPALNHQEVVSLVNQMNAEGVEVYGRLSPRVLILLTAALAAELHEYLESLDPFLPAAMPVSWAGESESVAWFDIARELTERWHHQQQIRLAVDRPGIMIPELYGPVLQCFMRGLPYAYRDVRARAGSIVEVAVTGDCGGTWWLERGDSGWALVVAPARERIDARTSIPQEIAWRVFTKGIAREEARSQASISGDEALASAALSMTAIVA
jgi:uncharacterized protein (TIGR03083 family)